MQKDKKKRTLSVITVFSKFALEWSRTTNRPVRSRVLYPIELPVHVGEELCLILSIYSSALI